MIHVLVGQERNLNCVTEKFDKSFLKVSTAGEYHFLDIDSSSSVYTRTQLTYSLSIKVLAADFAFFLV